MVFTLAKEMVHLTRTKRAGLRGSYRKGRVEYPGGGGRGGSVDNDGRSVLDDEYRVISS